MRYVLLFLLAFLIAGCGPVGPIPLVGMLGASAGKGGEDKKEPPPPFALTVDSLLVEGGVTDDLDDTIDLRVNGGAVTVASGLFSTLLDTQAERNFLFEAADDAGNRAQLHIQVQ